MATRTNRNPARRLPEASSLMGVLDFYPRPAIVLVFLTLTIAVVGWRIFKESGAPRMEALAGEAIRLYEASPKRDAASAPPEYEAAEKRILELTSVSVDLPRAEPGFVLTGLDREVVRNQPAAALRFRYDGSYNLLVVFRQTRFLGGKARAAFPEESLLSGEHDGKSFIMWERDGASFIMVSDADVIRAFGLVRRFFT
jgi:hypothetical protein